MTHWLDIALAVPLVWMTYQGFRRGFIMEVSRLIALIAGVYLAARFADLLSEYIYRNTDITWDFLPIVSFAFILVAVIVLVYFFGKMLGQVVRMVAMGWADKAAGALFGLCRAAFVISLALMMLGRFGVLDSFSQSETAKQSYLYKPLESVAPFILPILDEIDRDTVIDRVRRSAEEAEDRIKELIL